jgi:hypothetical protein
MLFGGNRANHQAGTKFAAGGFPYLFVIVSGRKRIASGGCGTTSCPLTRRVLGAGNDSVVFVEGRAFAGDARSFV